MLFLKLDFGVLLRTATGTDKPTTVRLLIGNPLIMKAVAETCPNAGYNAPITILVGEPADGVVRVVYDRLATIVAAYEDPRALVLARMVDGIVEKMIRDAAE